MNTGSQIRRIIDPRLNNRFETQLACGFHTIHFATRRRALLPSWSIDLIWNREINPGEDFHLPLERAVEGCQAMDEPLL